MYVLGVNTGVHDASAALVHDGRIDVMVEQERVSRRKRAIGESPARAIRHCLDDAGLTFADLDHIAVGWDVPRLCEVEGSPFHERRFLDWLLPVDIFPERAGQDRSPGLWFVPHHLAHAASALWTSGFERAAVLVIDGRGEDQSTSTALGAGAEIAIREQWDTSRSLGNYYGIAAEWAGMTYWDAGKLMGLAPYGTASQPAPLRPAADGYDIAGMGSPAARAGDHYQQLRRELRRYFERHFYPFGPGDVREPMAHAHFAASVQHSLEQVVQGLADGLCRDLDVDRLVIAGGVALNCTLNGVLARSGSFAEIYIPPVPHDAGVSLGAALFVHSTVAGPVPNVRLRHAYWGPRPGEPDELGPELAGAGLAVTRLTDPDLPGRVAERLADGQLVGWWQGRAEVGQRALGARSILCDPRRRSDLVRLNTVKGRETWRPLAPSVLAERADELFAGPLPQAADFMLAAWPVRPEARPRIPVAVHVDGTARPQLVSRSTNPRFWSLIDCFRQATGEPAVVNTSFNLAGDPIVLSAADAVATFRRSDLDCLVLGDLLVERSSRRPPPPPATTAAAGPLLDLLPWDATTPSPAGRP